MSKDITVREMVDAANYLKQFFGEDATLEEPDADGLCGIRAAVVQYVDGDDEEETWDPTQNVWDDPTLTFIDTKIKFRCHRHKWPWEHLNEINQAFHVPSDRKIASVMSQGRAYIEKRNLVGAIDFQQRQIGPEHWIVVRIK